MGLTSLQVCMDSSNWLQGPIYDHNAMDISSSSPSDDILTCSRPLTERRLRPPHDQPQKCPRCDSTHTKFCYYNNYSLSQPRYFCKACRRYWTKGGTLRNIPIGGGCRKNKKVSTNPRKLSNDTNHPQGLTMNNTHTLGASSSNSPDLQMSHFKGMYGGSMFESPRLIDHFVENKYEFMANLVAPNSYAISSPFGMGMDMCQTTMLPYHDDHHQGAMDVKPSTKLLALEWQGQGFSHDQSGNYHDSFGYVNNGIGSSWNGSINGYGSSDMNPLV